MSYRHLTVECLPDTLEELNEPLHFGQQQQGEVNMTHELMTPDEAAKRLRARVGTMQWWRTMGRGPRYIKIGRHVLYRAADLDEFIAAGERSPAQVA